LELFIPKSGRGVFAIDVCVLVMKIAFARLAFIFCEANLLLLHAEICQSFMKFYLAQIVKGKICSQRKNNLERPEDFRIRQMCLRRKPR